MAFNRLKLVKSQISNVYYFCSITFKDDWREVVSLAVRRGIPVPCFSTALAFYDGYRSARLPANLIQVWSHSNYELKIR